MSKNAFAVFFHIKHYVKEFNYNPYSSSYLYFTDSKEFQN